MNANRSNRRRWAGILTLALALTAFWGGMIAQAQTAVTLFDSGAGVRALGMGGAFVGLADDEQAVFYNPAGLAYLKTLQLSSTYERRFWTSNYLSALGALPHLGGGLFLFSLDSVEERDTQDNVVGSFGYLDLGLLVAGGLSLDELPLPFTRGLSFLALGGGAKFLGISTIEGGSGFGVALDLGFLVRAERLVFLPIEEIRAGLKLENLGPGVRYESGRVEPWPVRLRAGFAVRPIDMITIALDVALPFEFHIGGEFDLPTPPSVPAVALRVGSFLRDGDLSFTVGTGVSMGAFRFDYAFISHPQLPGSHRLALAWRF